MRHGRDAWTTLQVYELLLLMELETQDAGNWQWSLLIVLGVIGTVLLAFLLAQADGRPLSPSPSPPPALANATIIAASNTPLPAIPLLSPTLTATLQPTPIATISSPLPERCGLVPFGWLPTTVRAGDSLLSLAIRSGASQAEIIQANCLLPESLMTPGLIIYLPPTPPPTPPCGPPRNWVQYVVQPGDTMSSLARTRGTTIARILSANCLNDTTLYAGQVIFLPPAVPTATPTATEAPTETAVPPTNTPEPSPTATETVTSTATHTPSATATATAATPTITPSHTPSATPTETVTVTAVPPTDTPTSIPPTDTPTETAAATAVPATNTPMPTATPTPPLPTATPTPASTP